MPDVTPWFIYKSYPSPDLLDVVEPTLATTSEEFKRAAKDCGDTLFTFIVNEIAGCDKKEALRLLQIAMGDLQTVYNAVERI